MHQDNDDIAKEFSQLLRDSGHRIVFAESCTAGLISATLSRIPGISEWLVGSAVVYQVETKSSWLDVDCVALKDPGPVSQIVSEQMAINVLQKTPHATVAASITGHLGPGAPADLDGVAWCSVAVRHSDERVVVSRRLQLDDARGTCVSDDDSQRRQARQAYAVRLVMQFCREVLGRKT